MRIGRRDVLAVGVAAALLVAGCGGEHGQTTHTIDSGSNGGSLADLQLFPPPGSAFVPRATAIRLTWANGTTPPPTFTVTLQRYKEPQGSNGVSINAQRTDFNQVNGGYTWDLVRTNGDLLDASGVYYVEINAGSEQVLATYIVSGDRAEATTATRAAQALGAAEPPAGTGAFVHTVHAR